MIKRKKIIFQAGFQICKNGGTLYIKNGDFSTDNFFSLILGGGAANALEIIGESACDTCINGSVRIQSNGGVVSFRNIKFEIGDCAESNAALNIFSGQVVFDSCVFECFVNTGIYVHGTSSREAATTVRLQNCFIEGLYIVQLV